MIFLVMSRLDKDFDSLVEFLELRSGELPPDTDLELVCRLAGVGSRGMAGYIERKLGVTPAEFLASYGL